MTKEAWGDDFGSEAGEGEGGDMSCDIFQVSFGKYDSNYYGQICYRGSWCHCGEPPARLPRGPTPNHHHRPPPQASPTTNTHQHHYSVTRKLLWLRV